MNREIVFDCSPDLIRAAVIEDGKLCELHQERRNEQKLTESLFLGKVCQIRPSVHAAFLDVGLELNGFLPLDERTDESLRCGDLIIVQGAAKQATETKGLRLTRQINLAGKWLVLVPGADGVHVSKKVKQPELRSALLEMAEEVRPEGCGLIVRTASQEISQETLREEASMLLNNWREIERKASGMVQPGILSERISLDKRLLRDLGDQRLSRVVTNQSSHAAQLLQLQQKAIMSQTTRIEWFQEQNQLVFDAFQLEDKAERALRRHVWLDCGGYLIIESCEAMTVIDVNSGKMMLGRSLEENALRVNLEAAQEVARQIRLRDIGGMIVVDFIDLAEEAHRQQLLEAMRDAVKTDRAQVHVYGLTKLGLMEMTRKRVHAELRKTLRGSCSYCSGVGEVLLPEETARRALTQVRRMAIAGQRGPFAVKLPSEAAKALSQMTAPEGIEVYIITNPRGHAEKYAIEQWELTAKLPEGVLRMKKG